MSELNTDGDDNPSKSRRRVLTYGAITALAGSTIGGAWALIQSDTAPDSPPAPHASDETVPELVTRYAPDLYFGALEKWYPTDPRAYVAETAAGSVVDGFTALNDYSAAFEDPTNPPDPTVFYRVVEAAEGVDAIQYWFYSVFDQFTVNFHWHDWELLQVFVDRETETVLLVSASAHSKASPNNEFLEPDLSDGRRLGILSEVGSHSSASELNEVIPTFERFSTTTWRSDVTNDLLDVTQSITTPFAYGLPRDEGARLPFVMPELDGYRLDEHPALSVDETAFIDERVTIGSWRGLPQPPAEIPLREPGVVIAPADSPTAADARYRLAPMSAVRDAVDDFVGPQLSFEFAIPGFVETLFASHITSVTLPWEQPRYTDPLDDVTDPTHRHRIDGSRPPSLLNRVVGRVQYLSEGADGALDGALDGVSDATRDALGGLITVSRYPLPVEVAVRLASESPTATVTRDGVFGYLHVEAGGHLLTVNGPGYAPLAHRFVHEGGLFRAGGDGELTLVATEDAGWIRGDGRETSGVARVRVIEDYAGVVYDGLPVEENRFAVAVHRAGQYTVEITDEAGQGGSYRVGPDSFDVDGEAVIEELTTGKQSLIRTLLDELDDLQTVTRALTEDGEAAAELRERLSQAREEAFTALTAIDRGDSRTADRQLSTVRSLLEEALAVVLTAEDSTFSSGGEVVLEARITGLIDRTEVAIATDRSH